MVTKYIAGSGIEAFGAAWGRWSEPGPGIRYLIDLVIDNTIMARVKKNREQRIMLLYVAGSM